MLLTVIALATLITGGVSSPLVTVTEGRISGINEISTKGKEFFSYYGIPYAKPPVNKLRLKDPEKIDGWRDIKDGSKMPQPCLHVPFALLHVDKQMDISDVEGDEDCLYLNVFTPKKKKPSDRLPVMVFIHGGGFRAGAANEYLPHVLMNHNIVLVVLQYRLGVLGFISTEDRVIPGNLGLKDQTLALQWVQENIHNFGGDASRVTLFGESAGAASVHYHILSPMSKGLFSRAIMQSGSALAPWAVREKAKSTALRVSRIVACPKCLSSHDLITCYKHTEAKELAASVKELLEWYALPFPFAPRVDGEFLPEEPATLMRKGRYNEVEIMAGVTREEGAMYAQAIFASEDLRQSLLRNFTHNGPISLAIDAEENALPLAKKIYEYYLGDVSIDEGKSEHVVKMLSDWLFTVPQDLTALFFARNPKTPTFRYELKYRGQHSFGDFVDCDVGKHWIHHADDLHYLFRGGPLFSSDDLPDRSADLMHPDDLRVRDIMTTLWTNFAATGNPTPDDSLGFKWEAATEKSFRHLALQPSPVMEDDDRQQVRAFLTSLPTRVNQHLFPGRFPESEESQDISKEEL